jgi:peptidoglycan hydrolase-like protein with peptidoglycan-binding domain
MTLFRAVLSTSLAAILMAAPAFGTTTHRSAATTAHTRSVHARSRSKTKSHKLHGQQAIDSERVTQIQQALIREHYLNSDANGQWDATTQAAMQKYQAAQGWQTKLMPDSRALVKLGLGPDYSTAINAKDVALAPALPNPSNAAASALSSQQTAGFAAAAGVNR